MTRSDVFRMYLAQQSLTPEQRRNLKVALPLLASASFASANGRAWQALRSLVDQDEITHVDGTLVSLQIISHAGEAYKIVHQSCKADWFRKFLEREPIGAEILEAVDTEPDWALGARRVRDQIVCHFDDAVTRRVLSAIEVEGIHLALNRGTFTRQDTAFPIIPNVAVVHALDGQLAEMKVLPDWVPKATHFAFDVERLSYELIEQSGVVMVTDPNE